MRDLRLLEQRLDDPEAGPDAAAQLLAWLEPDGGARVSDASPNSPPWDEISPVAWEGLLAAGRAKGEVDADEVVHVLKDVELTHEVIEVVQVVFAA